VNGTGTQIVHSDTLRGGISSAWILVRRNIEKEGRRGWDSRVRAQDFLTEDTGRGHSLGSEIEGWFASV